MRTILWNNEWMMYTNALCRIRYHTGTDFRQVRYDKIYFIYFANYGTILNKNNFTLWNTVILIRTGTIKNNSK